MKRSNVIITLLALLLCTTVQASMENQTRTMSDIVTDALKYDKWELYKELFESGSMGGYFTVQDVFDFVKIYKERYPKLVINLTEIGKSYQNRAIYVFGITEIGDRNESDLETFRDKGMMLFTSLHHSREPISLTMNLYILAKLMFMYNHGDTKVVNLFKHNIIWILPFVNIDGYDKVNKLFNKHRNRPMIRKNLHINLTSRCGSDDQLGVDLNRNYPLKFAKDNIGSSDNLCDEQYRGTKAFSESETIAVRDIILKFKDELAVVINFHSYGNLWIIPYNYDDSGVLLEKNRTLWKIYDDFRKESGFHSKVLLGNAKQTINYTANGEASDWITGEVGILSFSPELGSTDNASDSFYTTRDKFWPILEENYPPIEYLMYQLNPEFQFDFKKDYNQSISFIINQALSNKSNEQYRTTFGLQIYHKGLTQINYTINANFTFLKLRSDQIPHIKIASYEYDLDYYDSIASQQSNFTEFEVTDGTSKHRDLIYIDYEFGPIETNNNSRTDENNTIVSYNSIKPRIVKKREYQKLYFTLVGDKQVPAEKCTLHLEILRKGEPVFTYEAQVFAFDMKPSANMRINNLSENQFSYVVIYCAATLLSFLILAIIIRCISQRKKKKSPEQSIPQLPIDEEDEMSKRKALRRNPWKFWWNDYFRRDSVQTEEIERFTQTGSPDSANSY